MFWIHIHNTCVSYRHCHYAQYKIHKKIAQLDVDSESYALLFSLWSVFFTLWVCACACACKSYSRLVSPTDYIFIQPKLTLTTFYQQHFRKHWASKSASQRTKEKFLNKFATLCVLLDMLIISVISKPTAMRSRKKQEKFGNQNSWTKDEARSEMATEQKMQILFRFKWRSLSWSFPIFPSFIVD